MSPGHSVVQMGLELWVVAPRVPEEAATVECLEELVVFLALTMPKELFVE